MTMTLVPEVGKFLVLRASSGASYPWYREGGEITRLSGQRVYYKDSGGTERFAHDFKAICDTKDEVDLLLAWSKAGADRVQALRDALQAEDVALWETKVPKKSAASPAVPRVRRAR